MPARPPRPEVALQLPRHERAPGEARAALRHWIRTLDLDEEILQRLLILVSELIANAVEHSPAGREQPIGVSVALEGGALHVCVSDGGDGFEPTLRTPVGYQRGYGLFLVDHIAARWGIEADPGTRVWFELEIPPATDLAMPRDSGS